MSGRTKLPVKPKLQAYEKHMMTSCGQPIWMM